MGMPKQNPLNCLVQELVQLKGANGLSYQTPQRVLRQFSDYCCEQGHTSLCITKENADGFLYARGHRASTIRRNEIVLHDLAEFAIARGHRAYVRPVSTKVTVKNRCPYVFTDDEVCRFFKVVDAQIVSSFTNKALVDPVLFRVLYATGLRISEAFGLRTCDIDTDKRALILKGAKNGKDRSVPFSGTLAETIEAHTRAAHPQNEPDRHLFYCRNAYKHMDTAVAYYRFRDYLAEADIPHYAGGPCVHSFRHGFAVGCLKRWVGEGRDLTACLPYLSTYMGHDDLRATQYYLRLTADLYPDIVERMQIRFGYVIPEVAYGSER